MVANLSWAVLQLALGVILGALLLEGVLQANPQLLLRGMGAPSPIDAPLQVLDYEVRLSDADLFFWHSALIRPVPENADAVEANVHFTTDEFGFPNPAPSMAHTDVVVLGRSFSLGAQAAEPWPRRLAAATGLEVTNLSQAAAGLGAKQGYLRRFGLPRRPTWIILEVLPSLDIIGFEGDEASLVAQLPVPLLQAAARQWLPPALPEALDQPIYPLALDLESRTVELVFFSYYLSALTVDSAELAASRQWADYQAQVLELAAEATANGACVALLYAPTKEEVYIPLAANARQLAPVLRAGWSPWGLAGNGRLQQNPQLFATTDELQAQASTARVLVRAFAAEHGLPFIDPSDDMRTSASAGTDPFMRYDSHWSAAGQALVADRAAQTLRNTPCP